MFRLRIELVSSFGDYTDADAILATAPDLAVLDVMLPGGDGFELAAASARGAISRSCS